MSNETAVVEQTYAPAGLDEPTILDAFGLTSNALLGSGGGARIFALDAARVLRIQGSAEPDRALARLLDSWKGVDLGFGLPQILEQHRSPRQSYSIDVRLPGTPLSQWLANTPYPHARRRGLTSLLDAASRLRELPLPRPGFDRVLSDEQRFQSLTELLAAQIEVGLRHSQGLLAAAVPGLDRHVDRLLQQLESRVVEPAFCHADLGPANVLVDDDGRVTAVLDISVHALAADPVLDQVAAVAFLELTPYPGNLDDAAWLQQELTRQLAADAWLIDAYRRFYALYYAMDPGLTPRCAKQLLAA